MSGHQSGYVTPHINTGLINPSGQILHNTGHVADFHDLSNNQLPGFNGMQFDK